MNQILIEKLDTVERCAERIRQTWSKPSGLAFEIDFDKLATVVENDLAAIIDTARLLAQREERS